MPNSIERSNKELTEEWFELVWNHGDEEHIRRRMVVDVDLQGLRIPENSVDAFVTFQRQFHATFNDIWIDVDRIIEDGDSVIGMANFSAIHSKTGKPVNVNFFIFKRWKDGKIVESRNGIDFATLLEQVGAIDKTLLPSIFETPELA